MKLKIFIILALLFSINPSVTLADVWLAPPANPPNSNRPQPVDTGDLTQTKEGGLTVEGALTSAGILTVQSTASFNSLATFNVGVDATNTGLNNKAVYGHGNSYGVYGETSGGTDFAGVWGTNGTGSGWAGWFQGPLGTSGSAYVTGNLGVGNPAPTYKLDIAGKDQTIASVSAFSSTYFNYQGEAAINLIKSHNDAVGTLTTTINDEVLGSVHFNGVNTSNQVKTVASIRALQNGNAGVNNVPGALTFLTMPTAGSITERMRITDTGKVGIGLSNPLEILHVNGIINFGGKTSADPVYPTLNGVGSGFTSLKHNGYSIITGNDGPSSDTRLFTNGSLRITIKGNTGNVGIGQPAPGYKLDVQGGQVNSSGGYCIGGDCVSAWDDVQGTSYWSHFDDPLPGNPDYMYANNLTGPDSEFIVYDADYGGVKIANNNLQLDGNSLIYQTGQGSSPVLIDDQMMIGRRYAIPDCGHYCDDGIDLFDDENLIFGRVREVTTGNSNQNLLRLQKGDGNDATIDKFRVDLAGNTILAGDLAVQGGGVTGSNNESISIGETDNKIIFKINNTEYARIGTGGWGPSFGIGTDSPNAELEVRTAVVNNPARIRATSANGNPEFQLQYNDAANGGSDNDHWGLYTSGSDFRIWRGSDLLTIKNDGSGNVGIGTTNPQAKLDVNGDINATAIDATTVNATSIILGDFVPYGYDGIDVEGCYQGEILKKDAQDHWVCSADGVGGATPPGGATTQVQYNNNGAFAGNGGLVFDSGNARLTVTNLTVSTNLVIPSGSVGSSEIATGAVGSSEIATGAVGSSEIATGAVATSEILNGTIIDEDINESADIAGTKIADGTIQGSKLATNLSLNGTLTISGTTLNGSDANNLYLNGNGDVQIRVDANNDVGVTNNFKIVNGANGTIFQINESGTINVGSVADQGSITLGSNTTLRPYYLESNGSMIIRVDVDGGNTSVFGVRRQDENSNLFEVDESGNIGVVSEVRLGSNQATVPKMYADGGNFVIQLGQ